MSTPAPAPAIAKVLLAFAAMVPLSAAAIGEDCGPVPYPGAAGPYDYVDPNFTWNLNDINQNHWEPAKRFLKENRVHRALAEINYLLIRVPNHYPALMELGRIQAANPGIVYSPAAAGLSQPAEFDPVPECYFDRAFRYRPNDPTLRMIFGIYYHKQNRLQEALAQYLKAESMDPAGSEIQYNLGLVYFDLKEYETSRQHALKAYELGYPLEGLRRKLATAGHWPASGG